jgi:hypothetical protein
MSGPCPKCGTFRERLQRDHIIPRFKGGTDASENIQHLCANCHEDKTRVERPKTNAGAKAAWADPQKRAQMIGNMRSTHSSLASRKKTGLATKAAWADPEKRARMLAAQQSPEARVRSSLAAKALHARRKAFNT